MTTLEQLQALESYVAYGVPMWPHDLREWHYQDAMKEIDRLEGPGLWEFAGPAILALLVASAIASLVAA